MWYNIKVTFKGHERPFPWGHTPEVYNTEFGKNFSKLLYIKKDNGSIQNSQRYYLITRSGDTDNPTECF